MQLWRKVLVALLVMACAPAAAPAHWGCGWGWGLGLGLGLGVPLGVGLSAPLYRPYYYAPPPYPVYVSQPVVIQQPPLYVPTAPAPQPVYRPAYQPTYPAQPTRAEPPVAPQITTVSSVNSSSALQISLSQLTSSDAATRSAACVALGRMRTATAVEPLTRLLQQDGDPAVRDAAARGLGLIADPASLTALEQAAQADGDRDVRHSASFAAEVIRAHRTNR
jgi:hypothetical protein